METKIAAIWARVSTGGQAESSLDSQIERTRARLESEGYIVTPDRVLAVDWTSLDLSSCPEFQTLRQWIQRKEVAAIGILDRDRLNAIGLQRLTFIADCREAGVKLVICQGPPILDEPEGQLVELALAIGKERSVKRASQGSKDGLFDKLKIKRIPSFLHKVRGYYWEGSRKLVPNEEWHQVNYACRRGLEGIPTRQIQRELRAQGVSVSIPTIWGWLTNPLYGGCYYGHRKEAVEPCQRKGSSYGKSSQRRLPPEEWYYLPEVEVANPPLTWHEHLALLRRLEQNKLLAQRNGKRDYLLRGFIFCDYHQRRYHGQPHHSSWRYTCPIGADCSRPYLSGPTIEHPAKTDAYFIITEPDILSRQLREHEAHSVNLETKLGQELHQLQVKRNRNLNAQVELEARSLRGGVEGEVYGRVKAQLHAEQIWLEERTEQLLEQLANLQHQAQAIIGLKELRSRIGDKLNKLTDAEWREVFKALNLEIHVTEDGSVEIEFGLPLKTEKVRQIVLNKPGRG